MEPPSEHERGIQVVRAGGPKEALYVTAKSVGALHAAPKLVRIYDIAWKKLGNPDETNLRQSFDDVLGSDLAKRGFECLTAPPTLVLLYTTNERPKSLGVTDPRCTEALFVSYHLTIALETAQAGTDREAHLQLLALVIFIHELTHWCRRKAKPGSITPKGQGEAGKQVEVALFGGEVRFLGRAKGHPQYLISEDDEHSLKVTEASAFGFLNGTKGIITVPGERQPVSVIPDAYLRTARAAIDRYLQGIIVVLDEDGERMVKSPGTRYLVAFSEESQESGQRRSVRLKEKANA
ncbi:hypothetical protein H0H93_001587 [Arthromyces matolae]|nr:hypothetical protein H0H93_001587 [Arthromyces matolae]